MMTATNGLSAQLTQFADLSETGEVIKLSAIVDTFQQTCNARFQIKIFGVVSCALGSGLAFFLRADRLSLLSAMTGAVVTGIFATYTYFQHDRSIRQTLECCRTTEHAVGREVIPFQTALRDEVNAALAELSAPTQEEAKQKAAQVVMTFFASPKLVPPSEVDTLRTFLNSRYFVTTESKHLQRILSQPQSSHHESQELVRLLTQIHGHLHKMQFGVEWEKDPEKAPTLHSYFTLIEDPKDVYRAAINCSARSPAITT